MPIVTGSHLSDIYSAAINSHTLAPICVLFMSTNVFPAASFRVVGMAS